MQILIQNNHQYDSNNKKSLASIIGKANSLIDLIHESQVTTISSYLPYLSCDLCKIIILDPKYCQICKRSFCTACLCSHKPKVSRHIEELTDKLTLICKYNCDNSQFPLKSIYEHIEKCKFKDKYLALNSNNELSNSNSNSNNIQKKEAAYKSFESKLSQTLQEMNFESVIENKEINKNILCFKCNQVCSTKTEYIKHVIQCLSLNNKDIVQKDDIEKVFIEEFNLIKDKSSLILKEKLLNMRTVFLKELNWKIEDIAKTETECKTKANKIDKYNRTKDDSLFVDNNEIKALKEMELSLRKEKEKLLHDYETKTNQIQSNIKLSNDLFLQSNQSLITNYLSRKTESSWVKEMITTLSLGIEGQCSKCGSDLMERFTCLSCKQKFCKGKCITRCPVLTCDNYVCPKCTIDCSLCHKKVYCDKCKVKCFYEKCPNVFCVTCYKRNDHQARSATSNCRFFTCEKEKVNSCMMTTLYCDECKRRLCNDCLVKDTHYDITKVFK